MIGENELIRLYLGNLEQSTPLCKQGCPEGGASGRSPWVPGENGARLGKESIKF